MTKSEIKAYQDGAYAALTGLKDQFKTLEITTFDDAITHINRLISGMERSSTRNLKKDNIPTGKNLDK